MSERIEQLREMGNQAFRIKKYPEALRCYTDAIGLEPNDPVLYSNRAATLYQMGMYTQALSDCDKGFELNPDERLKAKLKQRRSLVLEKTDTVEEVPIELVDKLPADYLPLPEQPPQVRKKGQQSLQLPATATVPSAATRHLELPRDRLFKFSTLAHLPVEYRQDAMRQIIHLRPDQFHEYYATRAIEEDFLMFYLSAVLAHIADLTPESTDNISDNLRAFSQYKRFGISQMLIDETLVRSVFEGLASVNHTEKLNNAALQWGIEQT